MNNKSLGELMYDAIILKWEIDRQLPDLPESSKEVLYELLLQIYDGCSGGMEWAYRDSYIKNINDILNESKNNER